ncbi:MAG: DUF1405 domain-containing protein [Gorillibacterium sp.]|nr:DUF1405 domain-containing protein [Gorillibacterium sp.]
MKRLVSKKPNFILNLHSSWRRFRLRSNASLSYFWSKAFLTSRSILYCLFWVNLLGTIYGYYWYGQQLIDTAKEKPWWMLILVPDSPTGSLLFTFALLYLIIDSYRKDRHQEVDQRVRMGGRLRNIIEAMACAASFKYGVWAVSIIIADNYLGNSANWIDGMLSASHLGMAAEALLFARFFKLTPLGLAFGAVWMFASDIVDYSFGVYPSLSYVLVDKLSTVALMTYLLSVITLLLFVWIARRGRNAKV